MIGHYGMEGAVTHLPQEREGGVLSTGAFKDLLKTDKSDSTQRIDRNPVRHRSALFPGVDR